MTALKGKMARSRKKGATRSNGLLEIIHTDISGPLSPTICEKRFLSHLHMIILIMGYVFLLDNKSEALNELK